MSPFFTEIQIPESSRKIDYKHPLMLMGSCFSENIGAELQAGCFPVDVNPFGILYNPASMAQALEDLLNNRRFTPDDLFEHRGLWSSFAHHGKFSSQDKEACLKGINERIAVSSKHLLESNVLIITFGTAWVYYRRQEGGVVANCHKVPASEFKRERLSVAEIVTEWQPLLQQLFNINPRLKVLFTVSPIRHWKDGAHGNQLSKSTLLLAIDYLQMNLGEERVGYFPSYEIMMDQLRDYRFYTDDMLHIAPAAVKFIWSKFVNSFMDDQTQMLMNKVLKFRKASQHRTFNESSPEHQLFIENQVKGLQKMMLDFPYLNVQDILDDFSSKTSI